MNTSLNSLPATLSWNGHALRLLDQTRLPSEEIYIDVTGVETLEDCIRRLVVRGAPAIGCAAAFGVLLAARALRADLSHAHWMGQFDACCERLAKTRPTAVNLKWAVERCRNLVHQVEHNDGNRNDILSALENEACTILDEDKLMCGQIGKHGMVLLKKVLGDRRTITLMTHCNAGALATGGLGTALSIIYAARDEGLSVKVFADETRPLLQGARLTAWELARAGIDVTVICDNMAASVLREHKPDAVIVGADRIAANGDTANKIGTYGLAILARHHGVPFYVAAPSSTFDLTLPTGVQIPIELRARAEIAEFNGKKCVPDDASVFNPAFDITPAELITAHITEKGVFNQ